MAFHHHDSLPSNGYCKRHSSHAPTCDHDYEYNFKVVMVGDPNVGKTSLLLQYTTENYFTDSYITTIGVDFRVRTIQIDGKKVKLRIWDTAGQDRYKTIVSSYYRGAHGIVIVYDITNMNSFRHVEDWLERSDQYAPMDVKKLIVGNKCDLTFSRDVDTKKAKDYADQQGIPFLETSSKFCINVEAAFLGIAREMKESEDFIPVEKYSPWCAECQNSIKLTQKSKGWRTKCCL